MARCELGPELRPATLTENTLHGPDGGKTSPYRDCRVTPAAAWRHLVLWWEERYLWDPILHAS